MKKLAIVLFLLVTCFSGLSTLVFAFGELPLPLLEQYSVNEPEPGYGTLSYGLGPEFNVNDITFTAPYPDPALLTDVEKYMVAGCTSKSTGIGIEPYYRRVFKIVNSV